MVGLEDFPRGIAVRAAQVFDNLAASYGLLAWSGPAIRIQPDWGELLREKWGSTGL